MSAIDLNDSYLRVENLVYIGTSTPVYMTSGPYERVTSAFGIGGTNTYVPTKGLLAIDEIKQYRLPTGVQFSVAFQTSDQSILNALGEDFVDTPIRIYKLWSDADGNTGTLTFNGDTYDNPLLVYDGTIVGISQARTRTSIGYMLKCGGEFTGIAHSSGLYASTNNYTGVGF